MDTKSENMKITKDDIFNPTSKNGGQIVQLVFEDNKIIKRETDFIPLWKLHEVVEELKDGWISSNTRDKLFIEHIDELFGEVLE